MSANKKNDEWIRMPSKSHPGRYYLFNKATGATQWVSSQENKKTEDKSGISVPIITIHKHLKSPAQDRLKRLQHTLKTCQTKETNSTTTRRSSVLKAKISQEQQNEVTCKPSTSLKAKSLSKSQKNLSKRSHDDRSSKEEENNLTKRLKYSVKDNIKKSHTSESTEESTPTFASNKSVGVEVTAGTSNFFKEVIAGENMQNVEENKNSISNTLRSAFVIKIKEFCKLPFSKKSKSVNQKLLNKDKELSISINSYKSKTTNTTDAKECLPTPVVQEAIITDKKTEKVEMPGDNVMSSSSLIQLLTPDIQNIRSYAKGTANSRLKRLQRTLIQQQKPSNSSISSQNFSSDDNINNKTPSLQQKDSRYCTSNNNSVKSPNSTTNDDYEFMDWQSTGNDEDSNEISNSEQTLVVEKSKKLLLPKTYGNDDDQTMGDIIDTVNENLLRISAEKQKKFTDSNQKWRKDFYYFIVDTNVLLKDLTFVEDLTKMKLCDTKGSMVYVPYSVLQELDKLKRRSGSQECVKTLAVRAIKYLNSEFESNSSHVQAQSALDERNQLININSADDSILNCCFQVKEHIPNLLLLTEDVNLRNKATCSKIIVLTKSDLIAKRYDLADKP